MRNEECVTLFGYMYDHLQEDRVLSELERVELNIGMKILVFEKLKVFYIVDGTVHCKYILCICGAYDVDRN